MSVRVLRVLCQHAGFLAPSAALVAVAVGATAGQYIQNIPYKRNGEKLEKP